MCHCVIAHPQTETERQWVRENLRNARATGDRSAILIATMQLTTSCPGRRRQGCGAGPALGGEPAA